ncbi:hypothetical protein L1987_24187 [Smallanthus sonchifolius]|uniref:Uncharacterized protein n=1 Tax=Smallanthus sonchifolius TaxID=185202 RepID=A0ACB9IIZ5_9ASTR|nr:hypothetical protein L1987_24187 [Smallanthus sonchifolius]
MEISNSFHVLQDEPELDKVVLGNKKDEAAKQREQWAADHDPLCAKAIGALHSARRIPFEAPSLPKVTMEDVENVTMLDPEPPDGVLPECESIFDDHFDLISDKKKRDVMFYVSKKLMPTQKDVEKWCHIQSKYFFKMCEVHNFEEGLQYIDLEEPEEESEVESDDDETAVFMKIYSDITPQGAQGEWMPQLEGMLRQNSNEESLLQGIIGVGMKPGYVKWIYRRQNEDMGLGKIHAEYCMMAKVDKLNMNGWAYFTGSKPKWFYFMASIGIQKNWAKSINEKRIYGLSWARRLGFELDGLFPLWGIHRYRLRSDDGDNKTALKMSKPMTSSDQGPALPLANFDLISGRPEEAANLEVVASMNNDIGIGENMVMMNMEYAGDSILDNISIHTDRSNNDFLEEGEEQEVNSDQSSKHKNLSREGLHGVSKCTLSLDITPFGFFPGITNVANPLLQKPLNVIFPDNWVGNGGKEFNDKVLGEILECNRNYWDKEENLDVLTFHNQTSVACISVINDLVSNFWYDGNMTITGMEKWMGKHTNLCREEKRKTRKSKGQQLVCLGVHKGDCNIETCRHGMNKRNPTREPGPGTNHGSGAHDKGHPHLSDPNGTEKRQKLKIWSSKNRKPEKNLSKGKPNFQKDFVSKEFSGSPMLVCEFNTGHAKKKDVPKPRGIVGRKSVQLAMEAIRAKENKLKDIANNILTTDENRQLISSILGMPRSRILD